MIPQIQSRAGSTGTCFRTSLASILNLSEKQVPDFKNANLDPEVNEWLGSRYGLRYEEVPISTRYDPPVGWHLILGLSPRGGQHCVVGYDGVIQMDPHPLDGTRHGLAREETWGVLVPANTKGSRMKGKDVSASEKESRIANTYRAYLRDRAVGSIQEAKLLRKEGNTSRAEKFEAQAAKYSAEAKKSDAELAALAKSAARGNDSRRTRVHRALDCVMDKARASDSSDKPLWKQIDEIEDRIRRLIDKHGRGNSKLPALKRKLKDLQEAKAKAKDAGTVPPYRQPALPGTSYFPKKGGPRYEVRLASGERKQVCSSAKECIAAAKEIASYHGAAHTVEAVEIQPNTYSSKVLCSAKGALGRAKDNGEFTLAEAKAEAARLRAQGKVVKILKHEFTNPRTGHVDTSYSCVVQPTLAKDSQVDEDAAELAHVYKAQGEQAARKLWAEKTKGLNYGQQVILQDKMSRLIKQSKVADADPRTGVTKCQMCGAPLNGDDVAEVNGKVVCPDCADRRARLHRALDCVMDKARAKDHKDAEALKKGDKFEYLGTPYIVIANEGKYTNSQGGTFVDLRVKEIDKITGKGRGERLLSLRS